jgi:branched-chain amino acid transport system substrate-binding protein
VPVISTVAPWQPWFIGQQGNPGDPGQLAAVLLRLPLLLGAGGRDLGLHRHVGQLDTNKQVGGLFPNDGDGNAWGDPNVGFPPVLDELGYGLTDPGRYQNLTDDFRPRSTPSSRAMSKSSPAFRSRPISPPSGTRPSSRASRPRPRPSARRSCSRRRSRRWATQAQPQSSEVWWSPSHPFKSSLNGLSAGEVAAASPQATGRQWTQPIGFVHALFEMAANVMGRVSDAGDGDAVAEAIAASNLQTIVGPIAF